MNKKIYALILNNLKETKELFDVEMPKRCPLCSVAVEAKVLYSCYTGEYKLYRDNFFTTYFCPNCEKAFIGYYYSDQFRQTSLRGFEPQSDFEQKEFSKNIQKLSPDYCRIFNQAFAAQQSNLNDVCGIAYRKALEFLIKDYAILLNPDEEEKIKKMMLSPCINVFIDNKRIQKLATACAWLGNDETHYVRKHKDYNVDDLLAFINAVETFIDSDLSAIEAEKLLNSSKKDEA